MGERLTKPECKNSKECAPAKHHYDECAARVTAAEEAGAEGPKEDCVEECEFALLRCSVPSYLSAPYPSRHILKPSPQRIDEIVS